MTDKQRLEALRRARRHLRQTTNGYNSAGSEWKAAERELDALEKSLTPEKPPSRVPNLGPVVKGGKSVLAHDLTHITGGLPAYPAFDDGFGRPGLEVIAPETLTVTRVSSARRRDGRANGKAFYARGRSKIEWWFGHVDKAPAVGTTFTKGRVIARISANHEAPHLHVGVDARDLIGKALIAHTDYTHGAPTVREQLTKALY